MMDRNLNQGVIADFFRNYGSKIQDEHQTKTDYGVLMPVKRYGSDRENLSYRRAGFETLEEFVLISLGKTGIIQKGAVLWISGRQFRVTATDFYHYADQKLYQRAYLQQRRPLPPAALQADPTSEEDAR